MPQGFMAENGYSWSHGPWLFQIIGFDNVLLAPKQAKFILACGPIKQDNTFDKIKHLIYQHNTL